MSICIISAALYHFVPFAEVEYFDNQNVFTAILATLFEHAQTRNYFYSLPKICCRHRKSIEIVAV